MGQFIDAFSDHCDDGSCGPLGTPMGRAIPTWSQDVDLATGMLKMVGRFPKPIFSDFWSFLTIRKGKAMGHGCIGNYQPNTTSIKPTVRMEVWPFLGH